MVKYNWSIFTLWVVTCISCGIPDQSLGTVPIKAGTELVTLHELVGSIVREVELAILNVLIRAWVTVSSAVVGCCGKVNICLRGVLESEAGGDHRNGGAY